MAEATITTAMNRFSGAIDGAVGSYPKNLTGMKRISVRLVSTGAVESTTVGVTAPTMFFEPDTSADVMQVSGAVSGIASDGSGTTVSVTNLTGGTVSGVLHLFVGGVD